MPSSMSVAETARYLNVTLVYVYQLLRAEKLRGSKDKVSGEWRITPEAIQEWIKVRRPR